MSKPESSQQPTGVKLSGIVLILTNLIPLFGVLFADWSAFSVVVLYWIENLIIGIVNVLKMLTCRPDEASAEATNQAMLEETTPEARKATERFFRRYGWKSFFVSFFLLHYGFFCVIHGVIIFALLGQENGDFGIRSVTEIIQRILENGGLWFVLAIFGSHLFSFFRNFLRGGEYRRTTLPKLMEAPYPRVMILHTAIVIGAYLVISFGSPLPLVLILIAGKTVMDWKLHLREHKAFAKSQP